MLAASYGVRRLAEMTRRLAKKLTIARFMREMLEVLATHGIGATDEAHVRYCVCGAHPDSLVSTR